jgi:hypothetical protein
MNDVPGSCPDPIDIRQIHRSSFTDHLTVTFQKSLHDLK